MGIREGKGVWIRSLTRSTGVVVYQVRWRETKDGKSVMKSVICKDMQAAKALQHEIQARLGIVSVAARSNIVSDMMRKPGKIDLLIDQCLAEGKLKLKPTSLYSKRSRYLIMRMVRHFRLTITTEITESLFLEILQFYEGRLHTACATIFAFKRLARWCSKKGYAIDETLFDFHVEMPESKETLLWSPEQVVMIHNELLRPMPPHLLSRTMRQSRTWKFKISESVRVQRYTAFYPVFRLEILWAVRPKEVSMLAVEDWDRRLRRLTIPATAAKNGCQRKFNIDRETAEFLDKACVGKPRDALLLTTHVGMPWSQPAQHRLMQQILELLGIPGSLYCGRHFATTRICERLRGRLKIVQKITGHKTLTELAKYLHALDEDLQRFAASTDYSSLLVPSGSSTDAPVMADVNDEEDTIVMPDDLLTVRGPVERQGEDVQGRIGGSGLVEEDAMSERQQPPSESAPIPMIPPNSRIKRRKLG